MKRILGHAAILCGVEILLIALLLVAQGLFGWTARTGLWLLPAFLILIVGYVVYPRLVRDRTNLSDVDRGYEELFADTPARSKGYGGRIVAGLLSILLLILFRALLFQPFWVDGGSMRPGLAHANRLIVSKFAYGYSRSSIPLGLVQFSGRFPSMIPDRGDVVIYRNPKNGNDSISRVIGLPGDRIQMVNGRVMVNGAEITQIARPADLADRQQYPKATLKRETISTAVAYDTLDLIENGFYDNTRELQVPADAIFVVGDNRDNSTDSRAFGPVPLDTVIGKVIASV